MFILRIPCSACRRGGGKAFRKPTDQEIDYYRPYVFEIIRLVDPRVILLTGNVASQSVLRKTGITSLRGKWTQMGQTLGYADLPSIVPAAQSHPRPRLSKGTDVGRYPRSPQEI